MKSLALKLQEGILDDMDDILDNVEAGAVDDWLKEYASGKYKTMKLKNGTRKVWGTLIIKNFHEDQFPALNISRLEGSMYIENCSAEDLTGLFAEESFLTNDLHITKCDNLTDMTGAPFHIGGWLYVTACKSFSSLKNGPASIGNISVIKCKKRFKKSAITAEHPEASTIFCSEEEAPANLLESLSDPVLLRFMDQMKKKMLPASSKSFKFSKLFGFRDMKYDEITPSMRQSFVLPGDKKKMLTAARGIIKNKGYAVGIILCEDHKGNFIAAYGDDRTIYYFPTDKNNELTGQINTDYWYTSTEVISDLNNYQVSARLMDTKIVHIYDLGEYHSELYSGGIANARMKSREGMIDNSDAGLARYAQKQKSRYAGIIAKNKVMKGYKKRTEATAKLFERYANFIRKTTEDLDWYTDHLAETNNVYDAFGVRPHSFEKGLPYIYRLWICGLKDLIKYDEPTSNGYEDQLDKCIAVADKVLSDAGC